jgi:hypothetical protein
VTREFLLQTCLFGLSACIVMVGWRVILAWPTLGWRSTEGVVEKVYMGEEDIGEASDRSTVSVVRATFTYTVRGKQFQGTSEPSTPFVLTKRGFEWALARYPKGSAITVYYSNWDPGRRAVLKRTRIGWFTRACAVAAIGFLALGVIVSNQAVREAIASCLSDPTQCRTAFAPLLE